MAERQQALARAILQDPASTSLSSFIGVDGANATLNSGRMLIKLKPLDERVAAAPPRSSAGCSERVAQVPGITLYMQPVQDLTIEDRVSRTQFQFIARGPERRAARRVGAEAGRAAAARCRSCRRRQRPAGPGPAGLRRHRPRRRQPPRRHASSAIDDALYDAFGQRLISTIYTQANQYRVVLEVAPRSSAGSRPRVALGTPGRIVASRQRRASMQVPLSSIATIVERDTALRRSTTPASSRR